MTGTVAKLPAAVVVAVVVGGSTSESVVVPVGSSLVLVEVAAESAGPTCACARTCSNAMVLESAFSFLGIGIKPPTPSWGLMISDGLKSWQVHPHLLAAPAAVLALAAVAFSFVGDGLNDALNPKGAN